MAEDTRLASGQSEPQPGPFIAKVVSNVDPTYMGSLEVQILREVGNDDNATTQLRTVKYLNPFYSVTNVDYVGEQED